MYRRVRAVLNQPVVFIVNVGKRAKKKNMFINVALVAIENATCSQCDGYNDHKVTPWGKKKKTPVHIPLYCDFFCRSRE